MDYNCSPPSYTEISMRDPNFKSDQTPLRTPNPGQAIGHPQNPRRNMDQTPETSPQIVYVSNVYSKYGGRCSITLGAVQIIIGILCTIALNFAYMFVHAKRENGTYSIPYTELTGFILFIITGAIGIAAGKTKSQSLVTAFMILNLFSLLGALSVLAYSAVAVQNSSNAYHACSTTHNEDGDEFDDGICLDVRIMYATYVVLLCIGVLGVLMSVCGSCLGCRVACKPYSESQTTIITRRSTFRRI